MNVEEQIDYFEDKTQLSDLYVTYSRIYISNRFLFVNEKFISKVLKEKNNHLTPAYLRMLELQASSMGRELILPHALSKPRVKQDFPSRIDDRFEKERKYVENLEKNQRENRMKSILRKNNLIRRKSHGEKNFECQICCDECDPSEAFYCPNDHGFCGNCIKANIDAARKNGAPLWICLEQNCGKEFMDSEMRKIFSTKYLDDLYLARLAWEARRAMHNNFQQCNDCSWGCHVDPDVYTVFYCQKCRKDWCMICHERGHGKEECPVKVKEREDSEEALNRFVAAAMDKLLVKSCSKCHMQGTLNEGDGCNFITCKGCGNGYCYYCGIDLPKSEHSSKAHHYNRNINPNSCPLWHGIDQAKRDQVRENAIREWKAAHPNYANLQVKV